jgi:hypothetical protein
MDERHTIEVVELGADKLNAITVAKSLRLIDRWQ